MICRPHNFTCAGFLVPQPTKKGQILVRKLSFREMKGLSPNEQVVLETEFLPRSL